MTTMMKNQTAKADAGKIRLTMIPTKALWAVGAIYEYGRKKYPSKPDNWKDVEIQRYRDSAFRHFMQYLDNPSGNDPESGLPILWHFLWNAITLTALQETDWDFEDGKLIKKEMR